MVAIQSTMRALSASSARTGMENGVFLQYPDQGRRRDSASDDKGRDPDDRKKYGEAAKRVQAIGFDAIEIHCGHSYLMSQFISPYYNKRTDESAAPSRIVSVSRRWFWKRCGKM